MSRPDRYPYSQDPYDEEIAELKKELAACYREKEEDQEC